VVVSEGAKAEGGDQIVNRIVKDSPEKVRLGGIGNVIAEQIEEITERECRVTTLGHLQRGGTPTPLDRILATQFAVKAVDLVVNNQFDQMVALKGNKIESVPMEKVMGKQRLVPVDSDLIQAGLSVGTSFGKKL
jgi:6-phosphofructokinase 1